MIILPKYILVLHMEMPLLVLNLKLESSEQYLVAYANYFDLCCTIDQYDIPLEPKVHIKLNN